MLEDHDSREELRDLIRSMRWWILFVAAATGAGIGLIAYAIAQSLRVMA